jgi:hypothetical protein
MSSVRNHFWIIFMLNFYGYGAGTDIDVFCIVTTSDNGDDNDACF